MGYTKGKLSNGINDNAREFMERGQVSESGNDGWQGDVSDSMCKRLEGQWEIASRTGKEFCDTSRSCWWDSEPGLGRVANGVPNRVGQLKGYGNAQVPLQAAVAWRLLGGE
jgi:DNA (cytosine-5)-methyltransferase 1